MFAKIAELKWRYFHDSLNYVDMALVETCLWIWLRLMGGKYDNIYERNANKGFHSMHFAGVYVCW